MTKRCLLGGLACGTFTAALAIAVLGLPRATQAQGFPERTVRIIVPTAPGGSIDTTARVVAGKLAELWGKPVVIENRAGAAMIIGTEAAAKAAPDGYTLLVAHDGTMAMNPVVYPNLGYHSQRDFEPVALLTSIPEVVLVNEGVPAKSIRELVALAKANPGKLNHASGGTATLLALELFKAMAGVDITSIPFRGGAPAVTGVMSGDTQLIFADLATANAGMQSGKLRNSGGDDAQARAAAARRADDRRIGRARLRRRHLDRHVRAGGNAEIDRRQDRSRHQAGARSARGQGQARGAEHGNQERGERGDASHPCRRHREMGSPGEGQEHPDRAVRRGGVSLHGGRSVFASLRLREEAVGVAELAIAAWTGPLRNAVIA
jgi:tripartite-type tricarboxylate transporter receptor subunit TctC